MIWTILKILGTLLAFIVAVGVIREIIEWRQKSETSEERLQQETSEERLRQEASAERLRHLTLSVVEAIGGDAIALPPSQYDRTKKGEFTSFSININRGEPLELSEIWNPLTVWHLEYNFREAMKKYHNTDKKRIQAVLDLQEDIKRTARKRGEIVILSAKQLLEGRLNSLSVYWFDRGCDYESYNSEQNTLMIKKMLQDFSALSKLGVVFNYPRLP